MKVLTETELNKLNIYDVKTKHENCSYCDKFSTEKLLNEKCYMIEEWTSENNYIRNIIYDKFLESIPFDGFEDIKQIGEGGIVKVYSETWIDGKAKYIKQYGESLKKKSIRIHEICFEKV